MSIYTVHARPAKTDEAAPDPERFVFVRDGFYVWAFLLTPLWMLRYRLWLALLVYIVAVTALQVGLAFIGVPTTVSLAATALLALLVGFEAATLRRFALARRGWQSLGLVVGDDLDAAERRFYDAWIRNETPAAPSVPSNWRPQAAPEVIGLFPQPEAPR